MLYACIQVFVRIYCVYMHVLCLCACVVCTCVCTCVCVYVHACMCVYGWVDVWCVFIHEYMVHGTTSDFSKQSDQNLQVAADMRLIIIAI